MCISILHVHLQRDVTHKMQETLFLSSFESIAVGENIVVQQATEEGLEKPNETWFMAKVEEKPKKLGEA